MSTIIEAAQAVNRDHELADALAREAVCELRADWRVDRPEVDDEDVAFEPTPQDEIWYAELCREHEARIWDERIASDEPATKAEPAPAPLTFLAKVTGLAHAFLDHPDPDLAIVGEWLWAKVESIEFLEATSAEQYRERLDCMLDAIAAIR